MLFKELSVSQLICDDDWRKKRASGPMSFSSRCIRAEKSAAAFFALQKTFRKRKMCFSKFVENNRHKCAKRHEDFLKYICIFKIFKLQLAKLYFFAGKRPLGLWRQFVSSPGQESQQ